MGNILRLSVSFNLERSPSRQPGNLYFLTESTHDFSLNDSPTVSNRCYTPLSAGGIDGGRCHLGQRRGQAGESAEFGGSTFTRGSDCSDSARDRAVDEMGPRLLRPECFSIGVASESKQGSHFACCGSLITHTRFSSSNLGLRTNQQMTAIIRIQKPEN